ncbi:GNAT family N-acetyltransferase [Chryseobacterium sp. JJR-5R]|uniref:GNAT family N-acetyltransferase n=1 Tax=Chryseobacterium sp. JJR-5R TaxID=3093923 RepID=UPI002A74ABB1|nr:GNAT family N-acetyltransferase [Chryseobacterium sp. JJR-5R]WPO83228.1 GNAT family N-acetyltransferase [Chryseobacterium sp. JJR-5R]
MEFLQIMSPEDYRFQEIYHSYCTAFTEDERRDRDKLAALFLHPKVKIVSILHETKNAGYLILWELSTCTFVEHFEVFTEFRNQNLGSHIMQYLSENHPRIILEIEPENRDENAGRRYAFYRKNGFSPIDEMYVQPSYGKDKKPLNLWLLANYIPEKLQEVKDEIYDVVYH